jgi:hypothetical protein
MLTSFIFGNEFGGLYGKELLSCLVKFTISLQVHVLWMLVC